MIKNFTILGKIINSNNLLDYLYQHRENVDSLAVPEESKQEKFCLKHPQKKAKYFCENDQSHICSKCIVTDHKGHRIGDKDDSQQ